MGAADEQHPAVSGGNRPKQPDLQLNTKGTAGEQPAVSASLKDAYSRVLEHLHQNALTSSDLQQIRKAVNFLMPMCQANRQTQRELMGVNMKTTALLNTAR